MAEKTVTPSSYETILLLNKSKAFDTVNRGILYEDLRKISYPKIPQLQDHIYTTPKMVIALIQTKSIWMM